MLDYVNLCRLIPNRISADPMKSRTYLICVTPEPTSDDSIDIQALNLGRVFGYHITQLIPKLMLGFAVLRREIVVVDTLGKNLARLIKPVNVDQVADVLLAVLGKHLDVAAEHSDPSLRDRVLPHKLNVQRPDAVVLGRGQGAQGTVKHAAGARDALLFHEELAIVDPDARHFVHKDKTPFEAVVDLVVARICDASALDLLPPHLKNNTKR